jgi:peroxiredoxin Q/BCP
MVQLRQDFPEFQKQGTVILVVGPEGPSAFAKFWKANDLPFIGLPDPSHRVLRLYGQQIKLFKFGPMPAQVLIDREGIARFAHYGQDMTDIPESHAMLELVEKLGRNLAS